MPRKRKPAELVKSNTDNTKSDIVVPADTAVQTEREIIDNAIKAYNDFIRKNGIQPGVIEAYSQASRRAFNDLAKGEANIDLGYATKISQNTKRLIQKMLMDAKGYGIDEFEGWCNRKNVIFDFMEYYYNVCLDEAPYYFGSYMTYLEKGRREKDKFYKPRKKCFQRIGLLQALQNMETSDLRLLCLSLPPGTGKTTIEKFFATWVIGRHPDDFSLFFSHSGDITRMFYDGILDITTNKTEYCWQDIFPNLPLQNTNAKSEQINFGKYKPFSSIQCTSVGAKNAGKVRCNRYLYCDDLIGGIEEALNKNILDKLWSIYTVDARQRMIENDDGFCKELILATRWSVHDPIGRLKTTFEDDPTAKFIAYPDIDPKTGKSNFAYDRNGFSVKFFESQALLMDDISYRCLYKNEPIEREGLLYHDSELRRYMDLPSREPDAIIGVCDTKSKGIDYMVLPVVYVYDDDYYLVDCVCDNSSDYNLQEEKLTSIICKHEMQRCEFESNAGGDRLAANVAKKVKEREGRCSITTKPTETNKETRIIVNSNWVKEHVLFKDKSLYTRKSDYGEFMNQLLSYSVSGKNVHDDVPDAMANFALFATKPERRVARIMSSFM